MFHTIFEIEHPMTPQLVWCIEIYNSTFLVVCYAGKNISHKHAFKVLNS